MRKRLLALLFVGAAVLGCTPADPGSSPDLSSPDLSSPAGETPGAASPSDAMSPSPSAS